jgi:hypothetical protein
MEELVFKHSAFNVLKRVIGVICLVCSIGWLIVHLGSLNFFDVIYFITFVVLGGSHLTNGFGTEKTYIQSVNGVLIIKWLNRFVPIQFPDDEIEKITLTRSKVIISAKGKKARNFSLDFLERDQKRELYEFLIEYAGKQNLSLVRDF